ncbi:MAG: type II toxin-antitoxin system VapC family toxin, partial [Deltaproteobacteria bacterium]|nr:type II toxin-antitoxin system VapC family toxin [Candidatus Tharpella aukensis]
MIQKNYLFDTHSLIFWHTREYVSDEFLSFFDSQVLKKRLYVSAVSFWETALLVKKGKLACFDVDCWKNELLDKAMIQIIEPTASEMIFSVGLPDHHKDPFDRLLIVQARQNNLKMVTKDKLISAYEVETF